MKTTIRSLSFTKRNIPIPADYRPLFKIGHIVLTLFNCCRNNKVSLLKLHFFCWALKSRRNLAVVEGWIKDDFKNEFHIWGIEPTVNRALRFAVADGLVDDKGGEFILTNKGIAFAKIINKDKEVFLNEKTFLESLGKNGVTEQRIKDLSQKFF